MEGGGCLTLLQMCQVLATLGTLYKPMPLPPSRSSASSPFRPNPQSSATFYQVPATASGVSAQGPRTFRCSFLMTCLSSSFQ